MVTNWNIIIVKWKPHCFRQKHRLFRKLWPFLTCYAWVALRAVFTWASRKCEPELPLVFLWVSGVVCSLPLSHDSWIPFGCQGIPFSVGLVSLGSGNIMEEVQFIISIYNIKPWEFCFINCSFPTFPVNQTSQYCDVVFLLP